MVNASDNLSLQVKFDYSLQTTLTLLAKQRLQLVIKFYRKYKTMPNETIRKPKKSDNKKNLVSRFYISFIYIYI